MIIQPHLIDIDTRHTPDYRYDCPAALDDTCLIMCFRTPVMILTRNGLETGEPGCCIIHSLEFREYHYSVFGSHEGFRNDWLKADFKTVSGMIGDLKLPYDTLLPTGRPDLLESGIAAIREELENPDGFSATSIRLHLHLLLLAIKRAHGDEAHRQAMLTQLEREYDPVFRQIRAQLRREYAREYHIADLASRAGLSPERFSALYRKLFGSSPYAEMIDARMIAAKRLLSSTSLTVKEIADRCGWSDQYYFSRLFKEKCAVSPRDFRQQYRTGRFS